MSGSRVTFAEGKESAREGKNQHVRREDDGRFSPSVPSRGGFGFLAREEILAWPKLLGKGFLHEIPPADLLKSITICTIFNSDQKFPLLTHQESVDSPIFCCLFSLASPFSPQDASRPPATYPIAHPVQLGDSLEGERRREVQLGWGGGGEGTCFKLIKCEEACFPPRLVTRTQSPGERVRLVGGRPFKPNFVRMLLQLLHELPTGDPRREGGWLSKGGERPQNRSPGVLPTCTPPAVGDTVAAHAANSPREGQAFPAAPLGSNQAGTKNWIWFLGVAAGKGSLQPLASPQRLDARAKAPGNTVALPLPAPAPRGRVVRGGVP